MLRKLVDVVADVYEDAEATPVLAYGLPFLDGAPATAGSLVVVGGRPGAGKSYFGLQLLSECVQPGVYVSLEDPAAEVARRVRDSFSPARLDEVLLCTPKRPRLSLICKEIADAYAAGARPRMVVVDYIQLIQYDGEVNAWSQTDQIGLIIADLKALARELGFVLVLLCQLKRPMREDRHAFPALFDLRDSSNIENSAELVVLLHDQGDQVEARVAKNKSGKRGGVAWFDRGPSGYLVPVPARVDLDLFGDDVPTDIFVRQPLRVVDDLFEAA